MSQSLHASRPRRSRRCRWSTSGPTPTRSAASGAPTSASRPARPRSSAACSSAGAGGRREARRLGAELHDIDTTVLQRADWEPTPDGVNFADIACEIDKHLAPDAVVTSDAGNFSSYIHRYIGFRPGQTFLSSVVGAMGSGMPMAVAAGLRRPGQAGRRLRRRWRRADDRQRDRDGGAVRRQRHRHHRRQRACTARSACTHYMRYPDRAFMAGTRLTNPDFAAWGRAFGAEGITISDESEVADGIARAFAVKDRPVVVHCRISAVQMSAWLRYTPANALP